jgi:aspartyl protease family protein
MAPPDRQHRMSQAFRVSVGVLLLPALCLAAGVRVVGVTPGQSADVVIENGAPVTLQVGETVEGITLLSADRAGVVITADGVRQALPLVADPSIEHASESSTVTLSADARGQFLTSGAVNGRPVRFIVDTGATLTTLSRTEATRIGLDYSRGRINKVQTANGDAQGWRVSLGAVRVGDVTVRDVDAIVVDNETLPVALLGMSFLGRFDMQRQGSTLVLRRSRREPT